MVNVLMKKYSIQEYWCKAFSNTPYTFINNYNFIPTGYGCTGCLSKVSIWGIIWLDCSAGELLSHNTQRICKWIWRKFHRRPWHFWVWRFWSLQQVIWNAFKDCHKWILFLAIFSIVLFYCHYYYCFEIKTVYLWRVIQVDIFYSSGLSSSA